MCSTPYLPETDSKLSVVNHKEYQAAVIKEYRRLEEELGYHTQEDTDNGDNWESNDKDDITIISTSTLKVLCSSTLTPPNEYGTVQLQNIRQSIINVLMRVTCEFHDHGHEFILETEDKILDTYK